ncbi:MAG: class I SAM-dependent methyltransferase [Deltaproteobacteria bacterium]|nr:class I SAM-dependent methyltransferase [Deltaproteobacteria bacterium]
MRQPGRMSFIMISFIHETLYGLLRNSHRILHAAGLRPGQAVLEVGCGPGFFTVPAAKIVGPEGNILAFDVNSFAVEHVQNKIDGAGVTNAKAIIADAANMGLPSHSFDLAFVFGLAHPLGNMDEIWQELHRVIKPGGMLSIEGRLRPPEQYFKFETKEQRIGRYISRDSDYNEQ